MKNKILIYPSFLLIALISACASTPVFNTDNVNLSVTPKQAANETESNVGKSVLWGGMIINSANLQSETQLEVLAYPLNSKQRPNLDLEPIGRFLAVKEGFLETTDFAEGRHISIKGVFTENRIGRIGKSDYTYPTLKIEQLHLWPAAGQENETRFHFGLGVILHN